MINKIIISSNISGAGKDTAREYLEQKYGFKGFAFADKIREIAIELFNMQGKDRSLLQNIGEKMREIDPDVWVNYTFKIAEAEKFSCISDCRRENEYKKAIDLGYLPIRIVCDRDIAIERLLNRDGHCDVSLLDNESETGTRHLKMIEVNNSGNVEEMYRALDQIINSKRAD